MSSRREQGQEYAQRGMQRIAGRDQETIAAQRIARLQTDNDEWTKQNEALLEPLAQWQYPADHHGMKEPPLHADLPRLDRERTDG